MGDKPPEAPLRSTMQKTAAIATLAALTGADAFMATGPMGLRASPAPAISRAKIGGLKMQATDEKMAVGAKAEKFSAGFAHPEAIAGDSEIRKILPHRYPFLLVDKILECVPGELQVEAMAQLGGFVALQPPLAEP